MDRRRVLLLAALVLGIAALIASLSVPRDGGSGDGSGDEQPDTTATVPRPPPEVRLDAAEGRAVAVERGSHVVVSVDVPEAGEVAIPDLGLTAGGHPGAPARFDLLAERTGRYAVTFAPPGGDVRRAGTLVVEER